ncbi:LexA family transcriptional regulator [Prolixibacteraceae bacterium JC049]|nr:LexA family transcriptional regulator [Prolixibacteraceae bacterium JC049]
MENLFGKNLKYLRLSRRMTQTRLAAHLKMNASTIGSYENGRSLPRITSLQSMADYFNRPIDQLLNKNLEEAEKEIADAAGDNIRILPIVVDENNQEKISLVPIKASAGYSKGLTDGEFIGDLPTFSMPFQELSPERTYRVFQIEGDSMLPIPAKSYIICEYVQNWNLIQENKPYVVVTKDEGVVFKRIETGSDNQYILNSDNEDYDSYELNSGQILEFWRALGHVQFYK